MSALWSPHYGAILPAIWGLVLQQLPSAHVCMMARLNSSFRTLSRQEMARRWRRVGCLEKLEVKSEVTLSSNIRSDGERRITTTDFILAARHLTVALREYSSGWSYPDTLLVEFNSRTGGNLTDAYALIEAGDFHDCYVRILGHNMRINALLMHVVDNRSRDHSLEIRLLEEGVGMKCVAFIAANVLAAALSETDVVALETNARLCHCVLPKPLGRNSSARHPLKVERSFSFAGTHSVRDLERAVLALRGNDALLIISGVLEVFDLSASPFVMKQQIRLSIADVPSSIDVDAQGRMFLQCGLHIRVMCAATGKLLHTFGTGGDRACISEDGLVYSYHNNSLRVYG